MTHTAAQADAAAQAQSQGKGPHYHEGQCLKAVREALDIPAHDYSPGNGRDPWAIEAWEHAYVRHAGDRNPPAGVAVFWRGRPGRPGHVALSRPGGIWTTDAVRNGYFAPEQLSWVEHHWGLTYLGWTEDLNGVRLPQFTPHQVKPATDPRAVALKDLRLSVARHDLTSVGGAKLLLDAAFKANTGARRVRINTARAALKGMK